MCDIRDLLGFLILLIIAPLISDDRGRVLRAPFSMGWHTLLLMAMEQAEGYNLDLQSQGELCFAHNPRDLSPRLTLSPTASIRSVAADMAEDMMSFYKGNEPGHTPGLLPKPYYCEPVMRIYIREFGLIADRFGHRVGGRRPHGHTHRLLVLHR